MAGDEDKKVKKKKVKKSDKEASSKTAEAPAPAEGEGDVAPPADEEGAVPSEGADGEVIAEPPPAPKKKPKFFVHWDRKKPKFYDYNFDYGESYYSPVVSYLNNKSLGARCEIPRRMGFAERGINCSIIRKSQPDILTQNVLNDIRSSIRGFESFQRTYAHDMQRKYC